MVKGKSSEREAERFAASKMLNLKLTVVLIFTTFTLLACANGSARHSNFVIADSKSYEASLFRQNCAVCHGNEANGKEMQDGKLIPSLRYDDAAKKSEQEIYNQIANGGNGMPPFKYQLTDKEIRQMARFIYKNLQGRE